MVSSQEALQRYVQALSNAYEVLAEATSSSTDRNVKVSRQLSEQVMAGQRDLLELAKKVAADPEHFLSASYSGLTETAIAAQSRALAFAQLAYQEAVAAGAESRDVAEKLTRANRETAEAAADLGRQWGSLNPFAEMFRQGMDAFNAATQSATRSQ